ncbi:MAG TPA: uracil-DNA glycosylase family protein, partial [Proteiniclasticum sp.]|nr:uracil-DNA glycosylase family protein [Proteiniclasticum sp.]
MPDILVLGHDFSTVNEYKKMLRTGKNEINSPTWREMIKLFKVSGVDLDRCFFSNVYMGLRDTVSMTGVFPGSKNKAFVDRNMDFLLMQITIIKPKLIITLGKPASINLSHLSNELKSDWSNGEALSLPNIGFRRSVLIDNHLYVCIALEHTSMRNQNVKRRRYKNERGEYEGNEAEIEMLKDAMR